MIHLDTNYLIGSLASPSMKKNQLRIWFNAGEVFAVSAITWSESSNGLVTARQIRDARGMVQGRIIAFHEREAEMSAKLFNLTGRKRATPIDCFIAAAALCAGMPLATLDRRNFAPFVMAGLR